MAAFARAVPGADSGARRFVRVTPELLDAPGTELVLVPAGAAGAAPSASAAAP